MKHRDPPDEERYRSWRATVPWTAEQIVAALTQHFADICRNREPNDFFKRYITDTLAWVASGHLTSALLGKALPYLVTKCFCGKKALYRVGNHGRCSAHKFVKNAYVAQLNREREALRTECEKAEREDERLKKKLEWSKQQRRNMEHKGKA